MKKLLSACLCAQVFGLGSALALAQETTAPQDLLGYTEGAQVYRVEPVSAQINSISGLIYKQVIAQNGVRPLHMTMLVPQTENLKPAILYFPGGGFTTAQWDKFSQQRMKLAQEGFVVAACEYRVVPDKYPAIVEDAKAAVRYIRAHAEEWGIDKDKIGIMGDSAGGYVVQMLGACNNDKEFDVGDNLQESSQVQAVVSLYGISDLLSIGEGLPEELEKVHHSPAVTEALLINGAAFNTFAGASVFETEDKAREASPLYHVNGDEPPMLLMHGAKDLLVSPLQSKKMFEALKEQGSDVQYVLLENAFHGDLPWYQEVVTEQIVSFFKVKLGDPATKARDGVTL